MEKSAVIEEVAAFFSSTFFEHYNVPIRSPPCSDLISIRKMMCLSRCCYAKINKVMPENKKVQGLTKPEKPRKTKKCEVMQQ